ncbi:unnamed protein product [Litomosoides sigmodontis]|uniref:WW domain-containing protein n=1 Tax=Litomosoides sigmodontis TaxID=42156 RepID=A0A3P6UY65_LITSI|nr:unnamed protein product [Litomosoides sigmodontis]
MLNRRRRHQTPTFLEGTPGRYLRREAPPSLPTCDDLQLPEKLSKRSMLNYQVKRSSVRTKPELSSQSFNESRTSSQYLSKKGLTSSLSIGNVVQHGTKATNTENGEQRLVSISLQSLPGRSISTSFAGEKLAGGVLNEELTLPPNWAVEVTPEGIRYYVDHNNRRTHWIHPLVKENLPLGWTKQFDSINGVTYHNKLDGRTQLEHPGLATSVNCAQSSSTAHLTQRAESTIEKLNIIGEEPLSAFITDIPDWLRLYSRAPYELDHLLEWPLFRLPQLEQYDSQLMKLYKQEGIDIAIKYERFRREINREIARRQQKFLTSANILQQ